ncbi:MAG: S8/S53 family peptidase [Clostridia bacterium]|nr:S8/S53 family peptidase [Clostridia bacterium]
MSSVLKEKSTKVNHMLVMILALGVLAGVAYLINANFLKGQDEYSIQEVREPKQQNDRVPIITKRPRAANWAFLDRVKLKSLPEYNRESTPIDLRNRDIRGVNVTGRLEELLYANFNTKTKWPEELPSGFDPMKIMETGKTPALNIKKLHQKGIDGKGISIAMIDYSLLVDHNEYKDRLKLYEEINSLEPSASMHGSAMASIAVGKTVGVAPGVDLYFIGSSNFDKDLKGKDIKPNFEWTAKAIDRVLEFNNTLPEENKIKVISISAIWCPTNKGYTEVQKAVERAKKQGIFVVSASLFDTYDYKFWFHGLDRNPLDNPEDMASYKVIPWDKWIAMVKHVDGTDKYYEAQYDKYALKEILLVPMSSKTLADPQGNNEYTFTRYGGWSSVEPYIAGLYALACQVYEDITPDIFWNKALETGEKKEIVKGDKKYVGKMIDPVKLIASLEREGRK